MKDPKLAHEAQKKFCKKNDYPHFAPIDRCWRCGNNIYLDIIYNPKATDEYISEGYSVEYAGNNLITGCPHCHRSYVE